MAGPYVELKLGDGPDAAVDIRQLVNAASVFASLLREVAKEYAGTANDPVRWLVEIHDGSVRLPLRGEPATEFLAAAAIPEIATAIVAGVQMLDREPRRPPYYNDAALGHAKALANLVKDDLPISVKNGVVSTAVTKHVMANVDAVLGAPIESLGTLEGRLESVNIHGDRPTLGLYDLLTRHRTDCYFGKHLSLEDIRPGIGRRVAITGAIKTKPNGERLSIEARQIRIFPSEDDLPSFEDVVGILRFPEE